MKLLQYVFNFSIESFLMQQLTGEVN